MTHGASPHLDVTTRPRWALLIFVAGAALLAGASVAAAQDRNNTALFNNNGPYVGHVLTNTSIINNNGPAGSWVGNIVSNDFWIFNIGAGALWTGSVSNNNQISNESGATWVGDIVANNNAIFNDAGATWQGDVLSNGGANSLTLIDNRGAWVGAVRGNTTGIFTHSGTWTGDIVSNTGYIDNNSPDPTLNPGGINAALWTGNVLSNGGQITNWGVGTWRGDVVDNPGVIRNYGAWVGNLTNRGSVTNTGVWTGNVVNTGSFFRAENQIVGAFDNRGRLQLTGNLSGITTLTNSGRLELTHNSGFQTLSAGSLALTSTSSYEINVNAAGATDRIVVSGHAALAGVVRVVAAAGTYTSPSSYTILTAGTIGGQFAGVTTDLAFFAPQLSYGATSVTLTMRRNDVGFGATGATGNQAAVGAAVETLRAGNPIYDAVLWLTPAQARNAFDQLSGEAHASAETMGLEFAGLVGGVLLSRLRQTFRDPQQTAFAAMGYAGAPVLAAAPAPTMVFWTQFYGAAGQMAAGTGTSSLTGSSGGVAIGLERLFDDWRVGLTLHAGATSSAVAALSSTIRSTDNGLGVYGGREWGNTRLALGAVHTRHDIRSTRNVAFPGFTDVLSGSYAAATTQAFAELSQGFDLAALSLRPFAGLAHISRHTDPFTETGGPAALSRAGNTVSATYTTLGLQAERQSVVAYDKVLTASGSLGWRHAFATTPAAIYALPGSVNFSVVGAPLARDMLAPTASLTLNVSKTTMLDLSYDGLLGENAQTHSLRGTWATRF